MTLQMTPTARLPHLLFQSERRAMPDVEPVGDEVDRAIARAARRWPDLHPALEQVEVLVREDGVYQPPPAPSALALVKPASDLVFRLVCPSPTGLACSCEGWPPPTSTGPGDGLYCADILAYLLALYLDRPFRHALRVQPLPQSPAALWEQALDELRLQMTKTTFNQWLLGSRVVDEASTLLSLTVAVRNRYAQEWLIHRLDPVISRTLAALAGYRVQVHFVVF